MPHVSNLFRYVIKVKNDNYTHGSFSEIMMVVQNVAAGHCMNHM